MRLRLALVLSLTACACSSSCARSKPAVVPAALKFERLPVAEGTAVLVGAGDVTHCSALEGARATTALLERLEGTVFVLGDGSNDQGSPVQYRECFADTWGRFRDRIRPTPGNHDYFTDGAAGYYGFYGEAAGAADRGYYSYQHCGWHVVVLNGNCSKVGGCQRGSAQEQWLRADLAAHPAKCTIAYWHQPRFSSGRHGSDARTGDLWRALHEAGAELVLSGHDHHYERFAPLDPFGRPDPERGIRQFIAGTGGAGLRTVGSPVDGSEVRIAGRHGVLRLALRDGAYDWQFISIEGETLDSGTGACH